jgi:hypothetical protein
MACLLPLFIACGMQHPAVHEHTPGARELDPDCPPFPPPRARGTTGMGRPPVQPRQWLAGLVAVADPLPSGFLAGGWPDGHSDAETCHRGQAGWRSCTRELSRTPAAARLLHARARHPACTAASLLQPAPQLDFPSPGRWAATPSPATLAPTVRALTPGTPPPRCPAPRAQLCALVPDSTLAAMDLSFQGLLDQVSGGVSVAAAHDPTCGALPALVGRMQAARAHAALLVRTAKVGRTPVPTCLLPLASCKPVAPPHCPACRAWGRPPARCWPGPRPAAWAHWRRPMQRAATRCTGASPWPPPPLHMPAAQMAGLCAFSPAGVCPSACC